MSNAVPEQLEALRTLIGMAQEEISDSAADVGVEGSAECLSVCLSHLDNILWVSEQAGLPVLHAAAQAMQAKLEGDGAAIGREQGMEFASWLSDVLLYIDKPADEELIGRLLIPLDEAAQASVLSVLANESAIMDLPPDSVAETTADESATAEGGDAVDLSALDEDYEMEFNTDNMLGMLASELHDMTPDLAELTRTIVSAEGGDLLQAVAGYEELVSRVGMVARELGLNGLVLICEFVSANLALAAEKPAAERAPVAEVLAGWTRVVIEHLVAPNDDVLCIAVVDYLEKDNWPRPLPYPELRGMIEGLTSDLEVSGDFEVEAREITAVPEDVSLAMSEDASPELVEAFFAESPGHAETFSHLVEAISRGQNIQQNIEAAQRIAHTLKGSGNLVGVRGIANIAHHVEDIFEYIARHQMTPPPALAATLQEAADCLETMLESLQGISSPPDDAQRVLQDVLDWANRIDSGDLRHDDLSPAKEEEAMSDTVASVSDDRLDVTEEPPVDLPPGVAADRRMNPETEKAVAASRGEAVRVPLKVLDNIFRIVSETAITIGQIQERLSRLELNEKMIRKNDTSLQQMRYDLENLVSVRGMAARHRSENAGGEGGFDPLEMDEYDEFYGATHAYIEGVADSREILRGFSSEVYELNALFLMQQRLNKELQQLVMTTRMVPVSIIGPRLQRAVRQACRSTGKKAELSIIGQDLLLDGDVLNRLADPLMHMLRNAVDHSIETDEMRFDRGKPETGKITLSFRQEGNNIVVNCSDDGKGLDYERIREVAVDKNLLSEHEPADQHTLAQLILQSGFSTSQKVTQISGRGVGMDVVHNTIQSLNGAMDIGDAEEGGTLVSLRLPITLLTSHCLIAGAGKERIFAIPTISLTQILSPGTGTVTRVGDGLTFQLAQDVFTACTLNSLVGEDDEFIADRLDNCSVLLVQTAEGITAVVVERVVTSYDLVVKNMGAYIKSIAGIAGVSMLGNGDVISVLDLSSLLETRRSTGINHKPRRADRGDATPDISLPKVLIVDDSLSVRNSLSQLMSDGGYQVLAARDGLEAINLLESESPDIVLTDLEMPRMNGLDLVSYIRNSAQWGSLPIVMITSRTMAKHRQQAETAGVNRYITKPFTEDEVLASIDEQLAVLS